MDLFLTNQQIEELETFGTLELTDALMAQLLSWSDDVPSVNNCNDTPAGVPLI
jgi:hypothetical protein